METYILCYIRGKSIIYTYIYFIYICFLKQYNLSYENIFIQQNKRKFMKINIPHLTNKQTENLFVDESLSNIKITSPNLSCRV